MNIDELKDEARKLKEEKEEEISQHNEVGKRLSAELKELSKMAGESKKTTKPKKKKKEEEMQFG